MPLQDAYPGFFPVRLTARQGWLLVFVFFSYEAALLFSGTFIPTPTLLYPASAIGIAALFLEGLWLWPAVYVAALLGALWYHVNPVTVILLPVAHTIQALLGAYLLRRFRVDPLFRRSRDIFRLFGVLTVISLIVPTVRVLAGYVGVVLTNAPYPMASWGAQYMAMLSCLLILVPFLLRWFAKGRFSRTMPEIIETLTVFVLLTAIDYLIFIRGISAWHGISLVYIMLIPLFWIALRLRPRFISLALLITGIFAVANLFVGPVPAQAVNFDDRLFNIQGFMAVIAFIFYTIVSLEENRRLNANLLKSQVATLENAIARISSESQAKNDFIAILAHELRNPLAPIASAIDLLRLSDARTTEELETLDIMEDRMQTIRRLLDDLLDISRISEGKVTLRKELVNVESVARQAVLSTEHYFVERHQQLAIKTPSHPVLIEGDPVRLEQIITNLLTNASKYSDAGDYITLALSVEDDHAKISVSDTGLGIDPAHLENIFTPFHQGEHGARTRQGLGVGLALVRNFTEMHGGRAFAESKGPNRGSTFTVLIPLAADQHAPPVRHSAHTRPARQNARPRGGPTVLVVDDNDAAAWGVGKLLEIRGCRVEYAYSAQQAIEKAASVSPDIILLDLGLPDQEGHIAAKTMRARGFRGRLVALTGWSGQETRSQVRASGFEGYVVKPATLADLRRVIPEIG